MDLEYLKNSHFKLPEIATYQKDGRVSLDRLYGAFDRLMEAGWRRDLVCVQSEISEEGIGLEIPVYGYVSDRKNHVSLPKKAFWVLGGVHGEEPAGSMAIAEKIDHVIQLGEEGIPFVLMPMLNPLGYLFDRRYFNSKRDLPPGLSVSDSEHVLPRLDNPLAMRTLTPSSIYAGAIVGWAKAIKEDYPPLVAVDHHEDEMVAQDTDDIENYFSYGYVYGPEGVIKPLCQMVTRILTRNGFPILEHAQVGRGEDAFTVNHGFVADAHDGSIDEYLSLSPEMKAIFVIETTRDDKRPIPLADRVRAHGDIISSYRTFWEGVK